MNELKPCPFCGCDAEAVDAHEGYKIVGNHDEECIFTMLSYILFYESEEDAIDAWNRRMNEDVGVGFSCIICGGSFCGYPRCSTVPICNDCLLSLKSLIKTEEHTVRKEQEDKA